MLSFFENVPKGTKRGNSASSAWLHTLDPVRTWRRVVTVDDEALAARCAQGRVVVIDDDTDHLQTLTDLFWREGYATEAHASALDYLNTLHQSAGRFPGPMCVLSEVHLAGLDGLELQRRLAELEDTPMLLMGAHCGAREVASAFRQGAVDFLAKPVLAAEALTAVERALALSSERQALLQRKARLTSARAALTDKELFIARRVIAGATNGEIATQLFISERSVKRHRQSIFEKLGVRSTAEFVRVAHEAGL